MNITKLFNRVEEINEAINNMKNEYEELHQSRLDYMRNHEINRWAELDAKEDAAHIAKKNEFSKKIRAVNLKGHEFKNSIHELSLGLSLLAGIIEGWYNGYNYIIRDEKKTFD